MIKCPCKHYTTCNVINPVYLQIFDCFKEDVLTINEFQFIVVFTPVLWHYFMTHRGLHGSNETEIQIKLS